MQVIKLKCAAYESRECSWSGNMIRKTRPAYWWYTFCDASKLTKAQRTVLDNLSGMIFGEQDCFLDEATKALLSDSLWFGRTTDKKTVPDGCEVVEVIAYGMQDY